MAAEGRAQGAAWAQLIGRLMRALERGGRQWTAARRKESLQRVLDSSRSDAQRLQQRLQSLLGAWESDAPSDTAFAAFDEPPAGPSAADWPLLVAALQGTVRAGLPRDEPCASGLADKLASGPRGGGPPRSPRGGFRPVVGQTTGRVLFVISEAAAKAGPSGRHTRANRFRSTG